MTHFCILLKTKKTVMERAVTVFYMDKPTKCGIQSKMFDQEHEKQNRFDELCFNEEKKESEEEHSGGLTSSIRKLT